MGYISHNAIIVTDRGYGEWIDIAHDEARRLFGPLVSEIVPSVINGYRSFLVAPDGSKEGWAESDDGDTARVAFRKWLHATESDEHSSPFSWVEVQYGDDDLDTIVIDDSDANIRKSSPPTMTETSFRRSWREAQAGVVYPIEDLEIGPDDPLPRIPKRIRRVTANVIHVQPRPRMMPEPADDPAEDKEDAISDHTCQTCRHWRRHTEEEFGDESRFFGSCWNGKLVYGRTNGQAGTMSFSSKPGDDEYGGSRGDWQKDVPIGGRTDLLLYEDYSGYDAKLQTGQDFGCIHWQPPAGKER